MKKGRRIAILTLLILLFSTVNTFAAPVKSDIKVIINGQPAKSEVYVENGRTLLPLREISETLGYKVDWIEDINAVVMLNFNCPKPRGLTFIVGEKTVSVLDLETLKATEDDFDAATSYMMIDTAPCIIDEKTYVPVRGIIAPFQIPLSWNEQARTVTIDLKN